MSEKLELPIDKYKEEILDLITTHDVSIISSSTGSGKTTRVPRMILENFVANCEYGLVGPKKLFIAVTQPRRIATTTVASQVAKNLNTKVGGELVGYQISLDNQTMKDTTITFMTTGTLVQMLSQSKNNDLKYTHIILDEVHGRDIYTDMLLLQIKIKQIENKNWDAKIILLSATMNMSKLANYFDHKNVGRLEIPNFEKPHNISVFYIDDLEQGTPEGLQISGLQNPDPERESNNPNYDRIPFLLCQLAKLDNDQLFNRGADLNEPLIQNQFNQAKKGAVLIFLPGIGEISTLGDKIKSFSEKTNQNWVIKLMHSNVTDDEQNALFPSVLQEQRKIILATNIAESSITVKDVRYVIDFCLTRYMKYDVLTTFSGLVTDLSSRHQCIQRAGRAGRTGPGFCFRLVNKSFFNNSMEEESLPEMQHCGLGLAFLHLKKLNMGSPAKLFEYAIDPPNTGLITSSVLALKECGALTIHNANGMYDPTDGELTTIGLLACNLTCDPRQARLIAFGRIFGLLNESIVMAMSISTKSVFASFSTSMIKKGIEAWIRKMEIGGGLGSDAIANLGAYQLYLNSRRHGDDSWMQTMKDSYIRSATMRNVDYTIARVYRKLATCFQICVRPDVMYAVEVLQQCPNILFQLQLLIAFASYPNIFFRPLHVNHNEYKELIESELLFNCPKSALIIQPQYLLNNEPTPKQEKELTEAIQHIHHRPDSAPSRLAMQWNDEKKFYVIKFFPDPQEDDDWIGNVAKDVYRALKFKGMNQSYCWTNANKSCNNDETLNKTLMLGPRSPISMKFKCQFSGMFKTDVDVDRESVNLYTLDTGYPIPSKYILTALQLGQKKKLIAKDSTVLPPFEGLYTWLHLLLSPTVKFTKKPDGKSLFGGIAGLGKSIFPGHDSKVQFDVNVSQYEVMKINQFRKQFSKFMEYQNFVKSDQNTVTERELWLEKWILFLNNPTAKTNLFTISTSRHAMDQLYNLSIQSNLQDMFPPISID